MFIEGKYTMERHIKIVEGKTLQVELNNFKEGDVILITIEKVFVDDNIKAELKRGKPIQI
jgi:hypothetical protein